MDRIAEKPEIEDHDLLGMAGALEKSLRVIGSHGGELSGAQVGNKLEPSRREI